MYLKYQNVQRRPCKVNLSILFTTMQQFRLDLDTFVIAGSLSISIFPYRLLHVMIPVSKYLSAVYSLYYSHANLHAFLIESRTSFRLQQHEKAATLF